MIVLLELNGPILPPAQFVFVAKVFSALSRKNKQKQMQNMQCVAKTLHRGRKNSAVSVQLLMKSIWQCSCLMCDELAPNRRGKLFSHACCCSK